MKLQDGYPDMYPSYEFTSGCESHFELAFQCHNDVFLQQEYTRS